MMRLRCLLAVVFSLQLSTRAAADSNRTEDAQAALNLLFHQITSSLETILISAPNLWDSYVNSSTENEQQQRTYDLVNFNKLLNNLTIFANNITNGMECTSISNTLLDPQNYRENRIDLLSIDKQVYYNYISAANDKMGNIIERYQNLYLTLAINCIEKQTNCEAISERIVAEVGRLAPIAKMIRYGLLAEVHLLGYNLEANWESTRASLVKYLYKVIQNITYCLVGGIQNDINNFAYEEPINIKDSIEDYYDALIYAVYDAIDSSHDSMVYYMSRINIHCKNEYTITNGNIRNAILRANRTVNSLLTIAQEANVNVNCINPDLVSVLNASIIRNLEEYNTHLNISSRQYEEGVNNSNRIFTEIYSMWLEVAGCLENANCDYLFNEIANKTIEIPLAIKGKANSTSLIHYQSILAVKESGSKIVRDALEQLQAAMVDLKACIRLSLYQHMYD